MGLGRTSTSPPIHLPCHAPPRCNPLRPPPPARAHPCLPAFARLRRPGWPAGLAADARHCGRGDDAVPHPTPNTHCPPPPPPRHGPQTPAIAIVEMMQCVAQALSIGARKPGASAGSKVVDLLAPLLQLPHFDGDVLKKLKKRRITSIKGGNQGGVRGVSSAWGEEGRRRGAGVDALVPVAYLPSVAAHAHDRVDGRGYQFPAVSSHAGAVCKGSMQASSGSRLRRAPPASPLRGVPVCCHTCSAELHAQRHYSNALCPDPHPNPTPHPQRPHVNPIPPASRVVCCRRRTPRPAGRRAARGAGGVRPHARGDRAGMWGGVQGGRLDGLSLARRWAVPVRAGRPLQLAHACAPHTHRIIKHRSWAQLVPVAAAA